MMRDHSLIEELLAAAVLGGLSREDAVLLRRERESHGADCEECARLEAEYQETAGRIGFSLEPIPGPENAADDLLRRSSRAGTVGAPKQEAGYDPAAGRWWKPVIAIAAALAVALVLFGGGWLMRGRGSPAAGQPGARLVHFQGSAGNLAMAYAPGETGAVFFGSQLPDPGAGKVYEVWTFQGPQPTRMVCMTPSEGTVLQYTDAPVGSATQMAVTVESSSCPSAPTTKPVFLANIG
jgi:hypothetical protein